MPSTRSSTRRRTATSTRARTDAPPTLHVRDFVGGGEGFTVEWDVRPVYDFLFSTAKDVSSTEDLPPAERTWLEEARASLPDDVRRDFEDMCEQELAIHVASFVVERPELRTVDSLVEALRTVGTAELLRAMLSDLVRGPGTGELVERAVAGDEPARAALIEKLPEKKSAMRDLIADPAAGHARIQAIVTAWAVPFRSIEARISGIIERDASLRAADRGAYQGTDLIERTTGGIRWLPEVGIRRVILAPSYFSRPYNYLLAGDDWRFFGYPVADDALEAEDRLAPPPAVLRLHRALGDETRLRILKLLADRDLYLTEIAQQLELSKPTIKHHLAMLRAAGLVTVVEGGNVMYYTLRRSRIEDASAELGRFLAT
jgi:DNA-binding transcriptional ArsR family regulator